MSDLAAAASTGFRFWLGTHEASWLSDPDMRPLMVSRRRLQARPVGKEAAVDWVLDSGGFTELDKYHGWTLAPDEYLTMVNRWARDIGRLQWAAPQDWMCEPHMLDKTGLTVAEHQRRTVDNYLELRTLDAAAPIIPVLQGWTPDDYLRCVDLYSAAGVDLASLDLVGLGSVCRRQGIGVAEHIVRSLQPIRLHGFGMKKTAIGRFGDLLASADSMAWSFGGRRDGTCTHLKSKCANHRHWALDWYDSIVFGRSSLTLWDGQP